jgi:hypothetical protein
VRPREPMPISEHELAAMTADLDDMHHESMPAVYEQIAAWMDSPSRQGLGATRSSRRGFLAGSGIALGAAALAACGSSGITSAATTTATSGVPATTPGASNPQRDLQIAALATSLENLAVATYQSGIDAATAGKLGTVPPAVVTFAQTAQSQHKDHAAAWNAILTGAGKPSVTGVDTTVKTKVVDPAFAKVHDVAGLAKLALQLENVAAATYLESISLVSAKSGIETAATIQPVELQHAAILNFVLGKYPVPNGFASTAGARGLSDKIG